MFALGGQANIPKQPAPYFPEPLLEPSFQMDEQLAEKGKNLYWQCNGCHGANVEAKGMAPDLRASAIVTNQEAFSMIVRDGLKVSMGMPPFKDLTDGELLALRHFIRKKAREKQAKKEIKTTGI